MDFSFEINKADKYVVAVSFGPDSMALLNMLILNGANIVVAHVNYHRRPESNYEEESLRKFCENNNVPIEVLDTKNIKSNGNFQAWARKIRYEFFKEVCDKYCAKGVFVAHQQDDLIETYLMQKKRRSFVKYWGIAEENYIFGVRVIRPLLSFSKKMLIDYCDLNKVPYSIDSSNLENHYSRNKIRHTVVENMSLYDRNNILEEIKLQNKGHYSLRADSIACRDFLQLDSDSTILFISNYLNSQGEHKPLSYEFIDEMKKAFSVSKSHIEIKLTGNIVISKEYDTIYLLNFDKTISYKIIIDKPSKYSDAYFEIDFSNGAEDRNIKLSSYPITIRPISPNDTYLINEYESKARRLFIDWKLPHHLRTCWPGIYDKGNKLIYIPRYRKEFLDNHKSKFTIKFTKKD